jgi:hypothetical protein
VIRFTHLTLAEVRVVGKGRRAPLHPASKLFVMIRKAGVETGWTEQHSGGPIQTSKTESATLPM